MCRWKPYLTVVVAILLISLVAGCGKKKERPEKERGPENQAEVRAMNACEKALAGYMDALAANDYHKAVEFIDLEEMLEKRREGTATSSGPGDVLQMKEMFRLMMERAGKEQKGKLTYEILACHISGDEARVEAVIYRDGKFADRTMYDLKKRGEEWKLSGRAIRAVATSAKEGPPGPASQ
jgi:hypothetical protein